MVPLMVTAREMKRTEPTGLTAPPGGGRQLSNTRLYGASTSLFIILLFLPLSRARFLDVLPLSFAYTHVLSVALIGC